MQYSLAGVLEGLSYPLPTDPGARGDLRHFWRVFSPYQQLFWNEADVNNYWAKRSWWEGNRRGISWVSSPVLVLFDAQAKALFLFFVVLFSKRERTNFIQSLRWWRTAGSGSVRAEQTESVVSLHPRDCVKENWELQWEYCGWKTGNLTKNTELQRQVC